MFAFIRLIHVCIRLSDTLPSRIRKELSKLNNVNMRNLIFKMGKISKQTLCPGRPMAGTTWRRRGWAEAWPRVRGPEAFRVSPWGGGAGPLLSRDVTMSSALNSERGAQAGDGLPGRGSVRGPERRRPEVVRGPAREGPTPRPAEPLPPGERSGTGRGRGVTGARGAGGSEEQSYIRSRARREARPERSIWGTHSLGGICTHEAGRGPRSQREPWALRLLLTWARAAGQLRSYPKVMPRMRKTLCSPSLCVSRAPGRQACGLWTGRGPWQGAPPT